MNGRWCGCHPRDNGSEIYENLGLGYDLFDRMKAREVQ